MFIEQYPLDHVCATKQGTKLDGPCPLGPKEIDGLLVPPGKASISDPSPDSSSLTNEKDHHYFLNSADVCW